AGRALLQGAAGWERRRPAVHAGQGRAAARSFGRLPLPEAGTHGLLREQGRVPRRGAQGRAGACLNGPTPQESAMLPIDEIRLNFNPASLALLNWVLAFLMFGIALDTRVEDFRRVLTMRLAFGVGIAAQFIVLPAITFVLSLLLQVQPS